MGPAAIAAIPAVGSLVGSAFSSWMNRRDASQNRKFQERMRNTQWQAAVEDMRKAGINPALAYSQGPAAAPGGSMPSPMGDVVGSAMQAAQMSKSLKLLDAQVKTAQAEATLAQDRKNYLTQRGTLISPSGRKYQAVPKLFDLIDSEIDSARFGAMNTQAMAERNKAMSQFISPLGNMVESMGNLWPMLFLGGAAAKVAPPWIRMLPGKTGAYTGKLAGRSARTIRNLRRR